MIGYQNQKTNAILSTSVEPFIFILNISLFVTCGRGRSILSKLLLLNDNYLSIFTLSRNQEYLIQTPYELLCCLLLIFTLDHAVLRGLNLMILGYHMNFSGAIWVLYCSRLIFTLNHSVLRATNVMILEQRDMILQFSTPSN